LRKLVLTNEGAVFLKDSEVGYEIPLQDIKEVVPDNVGLAGNPYFDWNSKMGRGPFSDFPMSWCECSWEYFCWYVCFHLIDIAARNIVMSEEDTNSSESDKGPGRGNAYQGGDQTIAGGRCSRWINRRLVTVLPTM